MKWKSSQTRRAVTHANRSAVAVGMLTVAMAFAALAPVTSARAESDGASSPGYSQTVLSDGPVLYYRLGDAAGPSVRNSAAGADAAQLDGVVKSVKLGEPGPRPAPGDAGHVDFRPDHTAGGFDGNGRIIVKDPGERSALDFTNGEAITIEAWVNPTGRVGENSNIYIIGKGRTGNAGFAKDNQNWSLRLRGEGGSACVSFLFRSHLNAANSDWHRWTSDAGFADGTGWHHVVVTYTFGKSSSAKAYIDGVASDGHWDMGGASDDAPVVDNDEVWIGAGNGGNTGNAFDGYLDEVALYRKALDADAVARHYHYVAPKVEVAAPVDLPAGRVLVEVMEGAPEGQWNFDRPKVSESFTVDAFGLVDLPHKYTNTGVIDDRKEVVLVRMSAMVDLPPGPQKLLMRSLNGARLSIDGKVLVTNRFLRPNGSAHEDVPELTEEIDNIRMLPAGHVDGLATFNSQGGQHLVVVEMHVGGKKLRPETGEFAVSMMKSDGMYYMLSPRSDLAIAVNDDGWEAFESTQTRELDQISTDRRAVAEAHEAKYWETRRELARKETAATPGPQVPDVKDASTVFNTIDRFIQARLEKEGVTPAPMTDDYAFLRRLSLDTVGVPPTPAEITAFFAEPAATRRAKAIDRLLADERWADEWTGYWQDVLAENPGILKPSLNNTGPFRYWIYEALRDNKRMDEFVTELLMMEGSKYFGGPKGFEMASQNDVPMAAKAHIIGQAFLGVEMKCARCHDAPFHDVKQQNLFSMAAMLKRSPQHVPKTSTIPLGPDAIKSLLVEVTLKPGSDVDPEWPFPDLIEGGSTDVPAVLIRGKNDPREQLAALITWHRNTRFPQVIANRLWARYMGFGLIDPVDDWQDATASHPELLAWLGREFVLSGYDMKHIAKLIFSSAAYQRQVVAGKDEPYDDHHHLFASPARRRMSAEQVVDSLFATAGKRIKSELMTLDVDHRLDEQTFLNFGKPTRAWQFTSLSNERDRPSLAMPRAQSVVDVLQAFGWRESRQNPLSKRDPTPTVQQPAILANGVAIRSIASLSDDSAFTRLALDAQSPQAFIDAMYMRILSRHARPEEVKLFGGLIGEGFDTRVNKDFKPVEHKQHKRLAVSWSNHLSAEANRIKIDLEKEVRAGDPPTTHLAADWRERAEDMVWVLINSPEFVYLP